MDFSTPNKFPLKSPAQKREDALLECFILLEQNNFDASKEAVNRFCAFTGLTAGSKAFNELQYLYKHFLKTGEV